MFFEKINVKIFVFSVFLNKRQNINVIYICIDKHTALVPSSSVTFITLECRLNKLQGTYHIDCSFPIIRHVFYVEVIDRKSCGLLQLILPCLLSLLLIQCLHTIKTSRCVHGVSELEPDAGRHRCGSDRVRDRSWSPRQTMGLTELLLGLLWLRSFLLCAGKKQQCILTAGALCTCCV